MISVSLDPCVGPLCFEPLSTSALASDFVSIFGATLVSLHIGDDWQFDGSGNLISMPARVGNTATKVGGSTGNIPRNIVNDRVFGGVCSSGYCTFTTPLGSVAKVVGVVARSNASIAGYKCLARARTSGGVAVTLEGTTSDTWRSFYGDVVRTDTVSSYSRLSGVHLVESTVGSSTTAVDLTIFNSEAGLVSYQSTNEIGLVYTLSAEPSDLQRSAALTALKIYYGFGVTEQEGFVLDLIRIYGSALVGLWLTEDAITDGSNNVTSLPGRVGESLTNSTVGRFNRVSYLGRPAIDNPGSTPIVLGGSVSGAIKDVVSISNLRSLPFGNYPSLIRNKYTGSDTLGVIGQSTTSKLYKTSPWVTYIDGMNTVDCTTGVHIYEASSSTAVNGPVVLGCSSDGVHSDWPDEILCGYALSEQQSDTQRIQANYRLKQYYGLTITAQEQLTYDLVQILGSTILNLTISDDWTVSGGEIQQLTARIGSHWVHSRTAYMTSSSAGGHASGYFASGLTDCLYATSTSSASKSVWTVVSAPSPLPANTYYAGLTVGQLAEDNSIQVFLSKSLIESSYGWTHYVNGVSTEDPSGTGLKIIEGVKPSSTATGLRCGSEGNYNWPGHHMLKMSLSAEPTPTQRAATVTLFKSYYSIV